MKSRKTYFSHFLKYAALLAVAVLFLHCAGNKDTFQENPPFAVQEAYFQHWVAGTPSGGRGTNLTIRFADIPEKVQVKKVYFRGKVQQAKPNRNVSNEYTAYFTTPEKKDMVVADNPEKEAQNPVPEIHKDTLFNLKNTEAVLLYEVDNKTFYYKLKNLEEKQAIAYPGARNSTNN